MAMWNQSRLGDAGLDQGGAQPGTAVGKRRQLGIGRLADLGKTAPDQRLDRGVGLGDGGENLPAPVRRLDIAKADFEMPLIVLTASDEG
jgi:hypothetical protein